MAAATLALATTGRGMTRCRETNVSSRNYSRSDPASRAVGTPRPRAATSGGRHRRRRAFRRRSRSAGRRRTGSRRTANLSQGNRRSASPNTVSRSPVSRSTGRTAVRSRMPSSGADPGWRKAPPRSRRAGTPRRRSSQDCPRRPHRLSRRAPGRRRAPRLGGAARSGPVLPGPVRPGMARLGAGSGRAGSRTGTSRIPMTR